MYNNFGKQAVKGANIPYTFYFLCPNNLSSNKKKMFCTINFNLPPEINDYSSKWPSSITILENK